MHDVPCTLLHPWYVPSVAIPLAGGCHINLNSFLSSFCCGDSCYLAGPFPLTFIGYHRSLMPLLKNPCSISFLSHVIASCKVAGFEEVTFPLIPREILNYFSIFFFSVEPTQDHIKPVSGNDCCMPRCHLLASHCPKLSCSLPLDFS
ncbi:hypothetical protein Tco_0198911 [Tanacetum coccineum]